MQTMKYRSLIVALMALLFALPACGNEEPSRWEGAQQESSEGQATSEEALPGSSFNKFFPSSKDGFEVTYTQEKSGFAEASLTQDGSEVATLSVMDTVNNPIAAEKYDDSSEMLEGYPLVETGDQGTGILVADRFQVQVRSKQDTFDVEARKTWLAAFDLAGLQTLK